MIFVLDASALLAALLGEAGGERVDAVIDGAMMTTVNLAEVVGQYAKAGGDRAEISTMLSGLPLTYLAPDEDLAIEVGLMQPLTAKVGLSLADRICLAQARRLEGVALTADRPWATVAETLGVKVELIR